MLVDKLKKIIGMAKKDFSADAINNVIADIEAKDKEFADKKAKIREEHERGARVSKRRFTI